MEKKKIGKKQVAIVVSIFVLAILASAQTALTTPVNETSVADEYPALSALVGADNIAVGNLLGWRVGEMAKENLHFEKYDPNVLAMTDAGFAIVGGKAGGKTTEQCVDGVIASTGCTVGRGNLLLIHRSKTSSLWFAFYNNATGESLYFVVNESVFGMSIEEFEALPDEEVFTTISNYSPGRIAPIWAKGVPYEFLKAAEFHNHVCPGLTSGYYLIKYLDENLPLQSSRDKYEIIGCPPWCKDDALQVIFDKTVGKRFVAMHLTSEDRAKLPSGTAGIYIRWNGTTNTGHGLVLAFNWSKVTELCGKVSKLEKAVCMMDYLDQPEMFVSTVHEFDLSNSAELSALKYAGKNAYVELGLLPDPALANLVGPDNIVVDNLLGWRAAEIAKQELGFEKYDPDVLAMTDASFAIVGGEAGGKTTEKCVDGVIASTGCTTGNGNLLLIHRSKEKPLWFAFFNNATGECQYLEVDNSVFALSIDEFEALSDEEVFTTIAKENISADEIFNNQDAWNAKKNAKVFNGNEFSITTIANVWAAGAPYEFLKAVEFHNHVCPGLSSGYVIVRYLDENLPLQSSSDRYEIIGCPPWCKDDAIQVIFDKTVGKRYVAMHLTSEDRAQLPGVAGIYIRWNSTAMTGDGLVLKSNSTPAKVKYGYNFTSPYSWIRKLNSGLFYGAHFDEPELFVSTMHAFTVNSTEEYQQLKYAGVNPYVELGLLP